MVDGDGLGRKVRGEGAGDLGRGAGALQPRVDSRGEALYVARGEEETGVAEAQPGEEVGCGAGPRLRGLRGQVTREPLCGCGRG